jgi:hypothetical protein
MKRDDLIAKAREFAKGKIERKQTESGVEEYFPISLMVDFHLSLSSAVTKKPTKADIETYLEAKSKNAGWLNFRHFLHNVGYGTEETIIAWVEDFAFMPTVTEGADDDIGRYICNKCGLIYTLYYGASIEGYCTAPSSQKTSGVCGGELIKITTKQI